MIYTGIGARKTPSNILHSMVQVGEFMYNAGHTLRSGGAQGADRAFEIGADQARGATENAGTYNPPELKHIYLPWPGFEGNISPFNNVCKEALEITSLFHPKWSSLSQGAKKMMGRNAYQLLGLNLDTPSNFMICWTKNGLVAGGTGQAMRMAAHYNIPIFNFGSMDLVTMNIRLSEFLGVEP